jgi:hypothetical protein
VGEAGQAHQDVEALGLVSTSIWRVKPVPNSGMPIEPVFPMIGSSSGRPSGTGDVKIAIVSGSSRGIVRDPRR